MVKVLHVVDPSNIHMQTVGLMCHLVALTVVIIWDMADGHLRCVSTDTFSITTTHYRRSDDAKETSSFCHLVLVVSVFLNGACYSSSCYELTKLLRDTETPLVVRFMLFSAASVSTNAH